MALKNYSTEVNGVKTTLRLSDADAKARGLTADAPAKTDAAAAKAEGAPAQKAAAAPANKSRTASTNK